jgi:hypothetical protein
MTGTSVNELPHEERIPRYVGSMALGNNGRRGRFTACSECGEMMSEAGRTEFERDYLPSPADEREYWQREYQAAEEADRAAFPEGNPVSTEDPYRPYTRR